jgi:hypothetical protein
MTAGNERPVENGWVYPAETIMTQACKTVSFLHIHHFQYAFFPQKEDYPLQKSKPINNR